MIPVVPAPEPAFFNESVRQPGLAAIGALVGEVPMRKVPGPRRHPIAVTRAELSSEDFPPYWRRANPDLLAAYDRICAYACLYIEWTTGSATVDHFAPRSLKWDQIYEWSNYRLACSLMNGRKREFGDVIDPFDIGDGLFALDLVTLKAIPGPNTGARIDEISSSIKRLGLDGSDYAEALGDYYHAYIEGHTDLHHVERRAPFLARELRRQGQLRPGDV